MGGGGEAGVCRQPPQVLDPTKREKHCQKWGCCMKVEKSEVKGLRRARFKACQAFGEGSLVSSGRWSMESLYGIHIRHTFEAHYAGFRLGDGA